MSELHTLRATECRKMAFGKSHRIDSRRSSSSYGSLVTLVMFVALCLVGVWMITSSSVVPVGISTPEANSDEKKQVQFEDTTGGAMEGGTKADSYMNINDGEEANEDASIKNSVTESTTENQILKVQEGNLLKENEDTKDGSDDASQTRTYHDTNENEEGQEPTKDGEQVDIQDKTLEENPSEAGNSEQNSDGTTNNDQQQSENENEAEQGDRSDQTQDENSGGQIEEKVEEQKVMEAEHDSLENKANDWSENQNSLEQQESENENELDTGEKSEDVQHKNAEDHIEDKIEEKQDTDTETNSVGDKIDNQSQEQNTNEVFPDGARSELLNEISIQKGAWSTQAMESKNQREGQKSSSNGQNSGFSWKLCNVSAGPDYIPCLDNEEAIKKLPSTKHYEHRERHCPEEGPTCLVPIPDGYRQPIKWPQSRDKIWYFNVPHTKLAVVKGHQNWVKVTGEFLTFPGGGTQFKNGALHYIDFIQETLPEIAWGNRSRVMLDVGCGVASFGGYLFDRDVLTMSFAPKDEHEAQVQFALERGIPAISAVMGTKRLPFPSAIFDVVHCARCRVPWHNEGGTLLLELNRLLRPGGYFVWSATPVYQKLPIDVEVWEAMSKLIKSMCWELVKINNDTVNGVGAAMYRKPSSNECYENREKDNPPLCQESDDPDAAWNIPLQPCMHRVPVNPGKRGSRWPDNWPQRLEATPYWLNSSQVGVYGKPSPEEFRADSEHWKHVVSKSYMNGMGINWSNVRNVMDMRSIYGSFAAALRDLNVWVMNVVPVDSPDTLPIIYERGLFGIYHDWCESFSTYPRTYDLLHADHLFSKLRKRCKLLTVIAEVDRILRPEGKLIVRDDAETISEVQNMARSLQWEIRLADTKESEGLLCVQKTMWRPQQVEGTA